MADIVEAISDLRLAITSGDKNILSSKTFKEFQDTLDSLNSKINRLDPEYRREKRRFHPFMFEEFMHIGIDKEEPQVGFLMMISFLKDDLPWIYEIGLETYKDLKSAVTKAEKKKLIIRFEKVLEMSGHPMMREFYGKSDDMYMYSKDIRHFMRHYLEKYLDNDK